MMQEKAKQFLSFIIDHHLLALEIDNVVEILLPPNLREFDRNLSEGRNNIFYKGKNIPVFSLVKSLMKNPGNSSSDYRIVVVGSSDSFVGLRVDSVEEILYIDQKIIQTADSIPPEFNSEFLDGTIILEEQTIYILSLKRILELITVE